MFSDVSNLYSPATSFAQVGNYGDSAFKLR